MARNTRAADFPETCPVCGGRLIGRIGAAQFFCWDCCAQFSRGGSRARVWEIDDDGTLVPHQRLASSTMEYHTIPTRMGRSDGSNMEPEEVSGQL